MDALTPTERAVAELLAEGRTNPQIGAQLYISRNTVCTHVSRALAKLGCHTRAELAVAITRHSQLPRPSEGSGR